MDNTTKELYDRQRDMELTIPKKVAVIGLGGGGSWVAITLALAGVKELIVMDNDIIEESNLNRTLYRYSDIGKSKVTAIKELIHERRPDCIVDGIRNTSIKSYEDTVANISDEYLSVLACDIVIDATDNYQTRDLYTHLYAKEKIRPTYCKLGYDGLSYELDFTFCHIEDSALQGYRRINTYVGTVISEVGALLEALITHGKPQGHQIMSDAGKDMANLLKPIADWRPPATVVINDVEHELLPLAEHRNDLTTKDVLYFDLDINDYDESYTRKTQGCHEDMASYAGRKLIDVNLTKLTGKTLRYHYIWDVRDILIVGKPKKEVKAIENQITNFDYEIVEEGDNVQENKDVSDELVGDNESVTTATSVADAV